MAALNWYYANHAREIAKRTAKRRALRARIFAHYGGRCACCEEVRQEFLCIDHMHGDGAEQRRERPNFGGNALYSWLEKNHYPEGYRVLCHNCNMSLGFWGYCPHSADLRVEPRPDAPPPMPESQRHLFE